MQAGKRTFKRKDDGNDGKDFVPISIIGTFPLLLVVDASLPVRSVKELIAYAKARPDKVNYAASAAPFQLAAELFNQRTGTNFAHIPYKGSKRKEQQILLQHVAHAPPPCRWRPCRP